jgi:anti-sigma regulatory factor (Ser/Thr protein kinase)
MGKIRKQTGVIRQFIVDHLARHPQDISSVTAKHFDISRQAASRHIRQMVNDGLIIARGTTRGVRYELKPLVDEKIAVSIFPELEEHKVWLERVRPLLKGVADNVQQICNYGFTEMLNNVIDHSESDSAVIQVKQTPALIEMKVMDSGIGIFKKIQTVLGLDDERHAILELSKGKLTTDPERHTGEGIFFTSRMFDFFDIISGDLYYNHEDPGGEWLLENKLRSIDGTLVIMSIHPRSKRTTQKIFGEYSSEESDYDFSKTHVVVSLVQDSKDDILVSRSQAKRLLARCDRFKGMILDFTHVKQIGQAFADEIFRVFQRQNPDVHINWVNVNKEVEKMIKRALQRE